MTQSANPVCPYCEAPAKLVTGAHVYPHRGDLKHLRFWSCDPCDAWVGTHKGSKRHAPLGRLANRRLRSLRVDAHALFDPLWQRKIDRDGCSKTAARKAGYCWLAGMMGIPVRECHISWFDEDRCKQAIEIMKVRKQPRPVPDLVCAR